MKVQSSAHTSGGLAHAILDAILNLVVRQTDQNLVGHQKGISFEDLLLPRRQ